MLQNASLLAIVAVHTAENELSEVGDDLLDPPLAKGSTKQPWPRSAGGAADAAADLPPLRVERARAPLTKASFFSMWTFRR